MTENPPIQIYPNKIKNRIVFKIKTGYKLELLTPETMKFLGSTKKYVDSDKNSEKVPKLESVEVDTNYWAVIIKMRYSTEARFRKYVKGYGFLSFAKNVGNKYGKKLIDTATKTGIDAAKTASKRVVQKTAGATGDLIGNKIADKITSLGKPKEKDKTKETEEIYIPPEKRQIIDDLRLC